MSTSWILPSNQARYDSIAAFNELETITWNLTYRRKIAVGDTVYLYVTSPVKEIQIQANVTAVPGTNVADSAYWQVGADDKSSKKIVCSFDLEFEAFLPKSVSSRLNLELLRQHGLNGPPQSLHSLKEQTADYIEEISSQEKFVGDASAEDVETDDVLLEKFKKQLEKHDYQVEDQRRSVKVRGSAQQVFADRVKENYGYKCALSGITTRSFLVASHIVPWADDKTIRLDPSNGICLSVLVDKAFEKGHLIINENLNVEVNQELTGEDAELVRQLSKYDGATLVPPKTEAPEPEYLLRRKNLNR